jgi:hypothetical protein
MKWLQAPTCPAQKSFLAVVSCTRRLATSYAGTGATRGPICAPTTWTVVMIIR